MYLVVIRQVSIVKSIITAAAFLFTMISPSFFKFHPSAGTFRVSLQISSILPKQKNQEPVFHIGSFYVITTTCLRKFRRCKTGIIASIVLTQKKDLGL